jgi:hypothetical protein
VAKGPHGHRQTRGRYRTHGRWQTGTFVAAVRNVRVETPWLFDGPVTGACVLAWCMRLAYVERHPVPTLQPCGFFLMDNRSSRHNEARRAPIRTAATALPFLPQYSPGANPIERLPSKLKGGLPNAAERLRDVFCKAIAQILDTISAAKAAKHRVNRGFARA